MELTLIRKYFNEEYTVGKLFADGKILCDTLEDKVRDLQDLDHDGDFDESSEGKIYGKTAIPCGRYRVLFTFSMKLKRSLPLLVNIYGYVGVRIHGGKNAGWTEGCILIGENKIKGGLVNFAFWETTINNLVRDAINRKEKVWITVKE